MDQQPNPDPHPKPESAAQDPNPNSTSDPKNVDNHQHTPNGDSKKPSVETGSDSQAVAPDDQLQQPNLMGSGRKSVHWSPDLVTESHASQNIVNENKNVHLDGSNPYISSSPAQSSSQFSFKDTMGTVRDVLGRWGKRVGEATRKAEDLAGNTWQHLKTAPSFTDAALGRIAQGTKILAEGGYEKIFQQTFETVPEEQLQNSFACYLSTSAGPVMGILYVSTAKLAYCSDNPLSYKSGGQIEWSYYKGLAAQTVTAPRLLYQFAGLDSYKTKVVMPLHQLKSVNPSSSRANPAEKYIQVISVDNHEFWFMGFLNYDGAVNCLKDALRE